MKEFDIYQDIALRTGGDIYLGVVGPVRTGKSTFIKSFMQLLVLPNIQEEYQMERTLDELPQSGDGRTITTTEPKFVPNEAIQIELDDRLTFRVRLVDCVGYHVPGALGYEEEDGPRMVNTPWFEKAIPFQEASELGTRKVIKDHSTIGLVVITDGSITEIPRENYLEAEERVIRELQELGKPFLILLNTTEPLAQETKGLACRLTQEYGVPVIPLNCAHLNRDDITLLLQEILYEFPVQEIHINLPQWMEELAGDHWLSLECNGIIDESFSQAKKLRDIESSLTNLEAYQRLQRVELLELNLGEGRAAVKVSIEEGLFFQVLEEMTGYEIRGDHQLFRLIQELSFAKKEYERMAQALFDVQEKGYGIVLPHLEDLTFEEPQLIKRGHQFGVKLKASAPSIHLIKADIATEVSPVVGTEKQCEDLIDFLQDAFEENPNAIWNSDFLGRSLHDLVRDGIRNKLNRMPENAQLKIQDTLQKIVNEGSGGLICIIL